jgi:hypothetical protein
MGEIPLKDEIMRRIRERDVSEDICSGLYHTMAFGSWQELEYFRSTRAQQQEILWICKYCKGVNRFDREHCANCGAPIIDGCKLITLDEMLRGQLK